MSFSSKSGVSQSTTATNSFSLKHILVSSCNTTASEAHEILKRRASKSTSDLSVKRFLALSSVLDELIVHQILPFHAAFDEYAAKLPWISKSKDTKKTFRDQILSKNGIPIIIVTNTKNERSVCLLEKPLQNIPLLRAFDSVLDVPNESSFLMSKGLISNVPMLMQLMTSAKDRAILQFVISSAFSNNQLHEMLGYSSSTVHRIESEVTDFLLQADEMELNSEAEAKADIENTIKRLEEIISTNEDSLSRKRKHLSEDDIEDTIFDIQSKRSRVQKLRQSKTQVKLLAKRKFTTWKKNLKRQWHKGQGKYRIDREAEKAIFEVMEEQLKAHRRRWGDEGTGYLENNAKRLHKRDLRRIANKYLSSQGKKLVKSTETVRSWGRCRNRRSRQARQHRGRNLWAYSRSQKTLKLRHINIHYNRAHIKNYTRFAFSEISNNRGLVVRRAIDDKAYVRCGTSEGFSRPLHRPLQISESPFELPASDYPDTVGYVSPGVILLVNEMKEVEHDNRDKFSATDVTVTVTCKPKHVYSSSATKWQNDLFAIRYLYPEEHNVKTDTVLELSSLPSIVMSSILWMRDSLLQYELMTIREDYVRVLEDGDHTRREELRCSILRKRLQDCRQWISSNWTSCEHRDDILSRMSVLQGNLEQIDLLLNINCEMCEDDLELFEKTAKCCKELRLYLESKDIPYHRPIDIQTSDAGPGVSSHERMTQIRLAESFMVNGLDLQCRFHYAPGDSASHIAEKVMRSLNECLGDGRSIPVTYPQESVFHEVSKDELCRVQDERARTAAWQCASAVSNRYDGKPCMGTSIHSRTPSTEEHHQFFFDEQFMMKCLNASSSSQLLEQCAGSSYYQFVQSFFQKHYYLYDNGCEGIRNGCTEKEKEVCDFHRMVDIPQDGWKGNPISRVLPPIPDYSYVEEFHYCTPMKVQNSEITEKFHLKQAIVKDTSNREIDDYCPRKQLEKLIECCGEPDLQTIQDIQSDGSVSLSVVDKNETLQKCLMKVDAFVEEYVGKDLKKITEKEIKRRYDMKVKSFILKEANASAKAVEKAKAFEDIDWPNLISTNNLNKLYVSQLHLYLMKEMNLSRSQCDAKGYIKAKKIEDIKEHYYSMKQQQNHSPVKPTSTKSKVPQTSFVPSSAVYSLPPTVAQSTVPILPSIRVPPWGGAVNTSYLHPVALLTNTCPIDNYLTIFYILLTDHNLFYQHLCASADSYARVLIDIKTLFDNGLFADGKVLWLSLFSGRFNLNLPIIDLWGNEEELFISRLQPAICSGFLSNCSSFGCPKPQKDVLSTSIALSDIGIPPPQFLQSALDDWMATNSTQSQCGMSVHTRVPGAPYQFGLVNHINSINGQIRQQYNCVCGGLRTSTRRLFLLPVPIFLPIPLDYFSRSGRIADAADLPQFVIVQNERFELVGLTFFSGSHYRGAVKRHSHDWYFYDGLWERNCTGSGLRSASSCLNTPGGYILSSSLYLNCKFMY